MSKIVVNFNFPDLSPEQYDKILLETEPQRKANYPGLLFHVAAPNGKGLFVCDIWESEEHFKAFGEIVLPAISQVGATPVPPSIFKFHNLIEELNQ